MKRKHLFITASLSIMLGVGVIGGVVATKQAKNIETVKAAAETEYNKELVIWHDFGGGTWRSEPFTHVAGPFQALYNFTFKKSTQFNFVYNGSTTMKNDSNYINSPANFGNYGGNNLYYWGDDFVADIVLNVRSQRFYIVAAEGHRSLTLKSNSAFNYLHFWSTSYNSDSDLSTKWEGVSFNKSGKTIDFPNCFNRFILNGGYTQTGDLVLSSTSGETGTVNGTGSSAKVSWLNDANPYLMGTPNSWAINSNYKFGSYTGDFKKISGLSVAKNDEFKVLYSSTYYGCDYCFKDTDGSACFQITRGGDMNIKCTTAGTFDFVFNTSSKYIYIYKSSLPTVSGYYLIGNNEFGDWSLANAIKMDASTSGNVAVLENQMSLTKYTEFKVIYYDGKSKVIYYNITAAGGTFVTGDWEFNYDGGKARYKGTTGSFNFYLQSVDGGSYDGNQNVNGTANFYIVDYAEIDKYGLLFIASNQDSSTLKITSKVGTSTIVLNNVLLSSVTGFVEYTGVTGFDGYSHLYMVPVYNLRNGDASKLVDRVIVHDSARTITSIPTSKGSSITNYYGNNAAVSTANGTAANAVIKINEYINNATNQSVCNLSKSDATMLKNLYDVATTAGSSLHQNATINTYTSTYEQGTKGNVLVSDIYLQIASIAANGYPLGHGLANFDILGIRSGNATGLIVILVSSLSVLGVGGYFFIRRKKQK